MLNIYVSQTKKKKTNECHSCKSRLFRKSLVHSLFMQMLIECRTEQTFPINKVDKPKNAL